MKIQYGKLYQYFDPDPFEERRMAGHFMVTTNNGWQAFSNSIVFVLLKKEKDHYVILLPDGELGHLYTRATRLKLAES